MFVCGSIKRSKKVGSLMLTKKAANYYVNRGVNMPNKKFTQSEGSGMTLTKSEIKR